MLTRPQSLISFYGGKAALAHLYPAPQYPLIIEPFAGSAAYSLRHSDREVLLIDLDPITASIWRFLLSPGALQQAEFYMPPKARPGDYVTKLLHPDAPEGFLRFLQSWAGYASQGMSGNRDKITPTSADKWGTILPRMRMLVPRVAHWKFIEGDYTLAPDVEATWFIDPPYNGIAGRKYRKHNVDYQALGEWSQTRRGQLIACENEGADWLPFEPLLRNGRPIKHNISGRSEVIHHRA